MTFPLAPLDVRVELFYDGAWQDITGDVNADDDIVIIRGRQDESSVADPARCTLMLNNTGGKYSPRNPRSPLFGKIGRNTPLRVRVGDEKTGMRVSTQAARASARPHSSHMITGDIDIRLDLDPTSWRPDAATCIASKHWSFSAHSWTAHILASGELEFAWTTDGTLNTRQVVGSTASVPAGAGRLAVRMALDADNGSDQHVVTFYTAPSIDGPWTMLGEPVVNSGTATIWDESTEAWVTVAAIGGGVRLYSNTVALEGWVYAFELRDSDGAVVLSPRFVDRHAREFRDGNNREWVLYDAADITDPSTRFAGEVSSWPQRWSSPEYVWVPIEASGARRRLGQGRKFQSAMVRGYMGEHVTTPVAYWPMEEGEDARWFSSPLGHHPPMRILGTGGVEPARFSGMAASEPVPTISEGGRVDGYVPAYTDTGFAQALMLTSIPGDGFDSEFTLLRVNFDGGSVAWIDAQINPSGSLRGRIYSHEEGNPVIYTSGWTGFSINGWSGLLWVYARQDGPDIQFRVGLAPVGASYIEWRYIDLPGWTFGRATGVSVVPYANAPEALPCGHVAVMAVDELWDVLRFASAWTGETARERMERLSAEEGERLALPDDDVTEQVGPQLPKTYLDLLGEAAETDMGILVDARDGVSVLYRSRATLYNQDPVVLDYAAGHISNPFEPEDDDQATRNDITVSRDGGSSHRVWKKTGALSIQAPPDGVGRYDDSVTLSLHQDGQTINQAGWRLHVGTVDEARYPQLHVALHGSPELIGIVDRLELGDRLQVANLPEWLPPGGADGLVQGQTETLSTFTWDLVFNSTPASPWTVGVAEDPVLGRCDTDGSTVVSPFVAGTDTELTVASGWFEDFENDHMVVTASDGGDVPWQRVQDNGGWCLRSGAISHDQTSDWIVSVPDKATTCQFRFRTSTEHGFDFLRILVDGVEVGTASGELEWTVASPISVSGAETITFRYDKDGSVSEGEDAVFIDNVSFQTGPLWTTDPAEFPFDITAGGVELRVTGIDNRLSNPGFETGIDPWFAKGATLARSTWSHTGSYSAEVTPDGATSQVSIEGETVPIPSGAEVSMSAWVWCTEATPDASCSINFFDDDGTYLTTVHNLTSVTAGVWTRLTHTTEAPSSDAGQVNAMVLIVGTPPSSNVFYVDDVSLVVNPGFRQTFTVEQTPLNGIEKTIPPGADVRLTHPMIVSL